MYCSNCGKKYDGSFCPDCGTPAQNRNMNTETETKDIAMLQSEQINSKTYKLSAGGVAMNGESQLITAYEISGNEVTATSYRRTTKMSPASTWVFHKQEIGSVAYKKTSYYSKLDKIRMVGLSVTTLLGFVIPPLLIMGLLVIGLYVFFSRKKTMIISLKNGTIIKAYYMDQEDANTVYKAITN